jgi:ABC-type transport system involved in multi-copper enzyme maturation permease subunit
VIAAMWALACTIAGASGVRGFAHPNTLGIAATVVSVMTAFYSLVLPAVIGSLACAEERHFGTLDAQLLLPVRSSTQWIVKSATALGLSLTLALLLPLALARLFGGAAVNPMAGPANRLTAESVVVILGVTAISLYVSTLARSGLRALMGSIATVFASGFMGAKALDSEWGRKVFLMVHAARHAHIHQRFATVQHIYYVRPLAGCALLTLMLVLALPHYRYAAGRPALVAMHAAMVLVCLLAYNVLMNAIMALRF